MKVKLTDRLLMAVYAILGILCSLGIGALILFRDSLAVIIAGYRVALQDNWVTVLVMALAALALLLWSVRILMLALKRESKADKSSVSVQNTENGSVRVSVQAMDMLVRQAVGNTEGVVDVKTRIINHEDSITVKVDMTLESDVHIPNVTMLMQHNIKKFIEEYSGIAVREVAIMVSKIIEVQPLPPQQLPAPHPDAMDVIDQVDEPAAPIEEIADEPPAEPSEPDEEPIDEQPEPEPDAEPEPQDEPEEHITEKDFW